MAKKNSIYSEFRLGTTGIIRNQMVEFLRRQIVAGALPPNSPVPPTRTLAALWQLNPSTVQAALSKLVQEGLLQRHVGRGTTVREFPRKMTCVGIFDAIGVEQHTEMVYGRTLLRELHDLLEAAGMSMRMWVDTRRTNEEKNEAFPELVRACERGEIQGLIVPVCWWGQMHWLAKLPVTLTVLTSENIPNAVSINLNHFMELALQELARQGCRSVGLIAALKTTSPQPDSRGTPYFATFLHRAAELKMEIRDPWLQMLGSRKKEESFHEEFGYTRFKRLWRTQPRPEGLVVFDDVAARGVVNALLEEQVRVPDELKPVFFRNREIGLFCPLPVSFVELNIHELAMTAVTHLVRQFREKYCEYTEVPFHISQPIGATDDEIRPEEAPVR